MPNQVSPPRRPRGRPGAAAKSAENKPAGKPYKSFPLTPHRSGQFCKKIRGKIFYFGKVDDPDAALKRYHEHCRNLHSGKATRVERTDEITVAELANEFLSAKDRKRENGDIEAATFVEYHRDCELFVTFFGKGRSVSSITRDDLARYREYLSRGANATTLSNRVGNARSISKFAHDKELIDKPVRFGDEFKRPERRVIRRAKAKSGRTHFLAAEIRQIIAGSSPDQRAMIVLGINCGIGNKDVGNLPSSSIGLERGWLDYPRSTTGVERRCPLWPTFSVDSGRLPGDAHHDDRQRRSRRAKHLNGLDFLCQTVSGAGTARNQATSRESVLESRTTFSAGATASSIKIPYGQVFVSGPQGGRRAIARGTRWPYRRSR